MIIYDVPAEACRELLGRTHLVRLACSQGDQPYIVPAFLYFEPGEDCLYGFAFHGQKIDWMRANPNVCVEVEEIVDQYHWTTVLVFGRYEEVGDSPDDYDARLRAAGLFQQQQSWWLPGAARVDGVTDQRTRVLYRIRINRMTGRRASRTDCGGVDARRDSPAQRRHARPFWASLITSCTSSLQAALICMRRARTPQSSPVSILAASLR